MLKTTLFLTALHEGSNHQSVNLGLFVVYVLCLTATLSPLPNPLNLYTVHLALMYLYM